MVFLPSSDPDVQLFTEVNHRFGGLRVALIGVEAPPGQDMFTPDALGKLKAASEAMRNVHGVDPRVLSLTHVSDVVAGPAGAEVRLLIETLPTNANESVATKAKVLSRDHIVGNLVSKDGRAALILVFLAEGARDRQVTESLRAVARDKLGGLGVYYGGAPFAGRAIYEEAQRDVWKLSPFAALMLMLVVVLAFRDPVGVVLTIASVAFAMLVVMGGMGWWGEKFTVASSTLPVILFASGSSYAIHVLGRYYLLRGKGTIPEVLARALKIVGPPLFIAAATTSVGFFSFVATDVRPMRAFGIACGAGVLLCWVTSLLLVPAVLVLWPRAAKPARLETLGRGMVAIWGWSRRHRTGIRVAVAVITLAMIIPAFHVKVRMDPTVFFRPGSEPWRAERFMEKEFGGAHFIQLAVSGDFDDPMTLRELNRLTDYTRSLPAVSQVQSITGILALVNDVMGGGKRLPATTAQSANLFFFLEGEAGTSQLLQPGRKEALVQVRLRGAHPHERKTGAVEATPAATVEALERFVKTIRPQPPRPSIEDLADRIGWVAEAVLRNAPHVLVTRPRLLNALNLVALPTEGDKEWTQKRLELAKQLFATDELPPLTPEQQRIILQKLESSADWSADLAAAAPSPEEGKLAVANLKSRLSDAHRDLAVARALPLVIEAAGLSSVAAPESELLAKQLTVVLDDRFLPPESQPSARQPMVAKVSGEPILDRGFSRSVEHNQLRSLGISVVIVFLLMVGLFRSFWRGFVCVVPSLFTMVLIFGVMGLLNLHIDLGTSLVSGICTGAGADFAMHYLWYLRFEEADEVTRTVGPVMAVSVLLVGLGFLILALGNSPVMRLFGTLAGLSMILSALFTCLLVPALLNKVGPDVDPTEAHH